MPPKKLRIAVAGAGLIGRRHIQLIGGSETVELAGIAEPSADGRRLADELGVANYRTLDELLDAGRPDGVIVATPNALHVENGLACIRRRIPVLVEKPIADAVESARRLVNAAEAAGVPLLVGHHRRHSEIVAKAQEAIRSGMLGPLVAVVGSALFFKPARYFEEAPWRREPGGGPILINLIHEVDNLRALCGEIVAVHAFASRAVRQFPVEDTVAINLRFAGGALGTFVLSDTAASARSWEQTSGENQSYPHYPDEDCYTIAGTRGSLSIPSLRWKAYAGEASWWTPFETGKIGHPPVDPLAR